MTRLSESPTNAYHLLFAGSRNACLAVAVSCAIVTECASKLENSSALTRQEHRRTATRVLPSNLVGGRPYLVKTPLLSRLHTAKAEVFFVCPVADEA